MSTEILARIRECASEGKILWRRHALERMLERGISRQAVLGVLINGEAIEDYSTERPAPTILVLGWEGSRPLHVVVALDAEGQASIITAYEPDQESFEADYRTRRKR